MVVVLTMGVGSSLLINNNTDGYTYFHGQWYIPVASCHAIIFIETHVCLIEFHMGEEIKFEKNIFDPLGKSKKP